MNKSMVIALLLFMLLITGKTEAIYTGAEPEGFVMMLGPRIGVGYSFEDPQKYSDAVAKMFTAGKYSTVNTMFGISFEQRLILGTTRSHFAFQEIFVLSGLEQSVALPSGALMIGFRGSNGFEFGTGPNLAISGLGVAVAVGWTISFSGVYIPIDLSCVIPNQNRPGSIALTTGFNFRIN